MRILLIHTSMSGGGIQSVVCNLANELYRMGESVSVCSISQPSENDIFWNKLNCGIHKTTLGKNGGGFSLSIVFKIYSFLKNNTFDIVHFHGFFCYYMLSVIALHRRIRFVYTFHSDAYMENGKWDKRFLFVKKFVLNKGWIIPITISHASQDSFWRLYGCPSKLVYNGIPYPTIDNLTIPEIDKYRLSSSTKLFIHVGRIDKPKNQVVLCKIFQQLINEGHDIVLVLVGGVSSTVIFNELKNLLSDRIVYMGPKDNIPQLMSRCDAMCLPSLWEGMPIVLLEAMSVGCIPICSPVGGIVNVITNGINGILSKSAKYDDYYKAVLTFLELSEDNRRSLSTKAIDSFSNYTVEKMAQNYLKAYSV